MRDFFTYNGINSADFGCYVANANQFDAPARDVDTIEVPGRNGALTIDNGRYLNQTLTYSLYVRGVSKIHTIRRSFILRGLLMRLP